MAATTQPAAAIVLEDLRRKLRAKGPAAVLGIGTANPSNCVRQDEFTDWYFRVTKSSQHIRLEEKMKRICVKSGIKKRYLHHTEDMITSHPEFLHRTMPSLSAQLRICAEAAAKLAADASMRAIKEWGGGRTAADITHLVVSTNSGAHEPGVDFRVAGLLGLRPTVHRTLLNLHGCSAGFAALQVAKNLAENNRGARVLVTCSQAMVLSFHGLDDDTHSHSIVANCIFGDGAGAVIVGADPTGPIERPIFYAVSTAQVTLPGTEKAVGLHLSETGLDIGISVEVPTLVRDSIRQCIVDAIAPLGLLPNACDGGWNSFFWAVHPGGRAILDNFKAALDLEPNKLAPSYHVLSEYGNMTGATIFFVLDDIRRRPKDGVEKEAGIRSEWGVMSGLGPGLTVETFVLYMPPPAMTKSSS